jgi:hypothetical protein
MDELNEMMGPSRGFGDSTSKDAEVDAEVGVLTLLVQHPCLGQGRLTSHSHRNMGLPFRHDQDDSIG